MTDAPTWAATAPHVTLVEIAGELDAKAAPTIAPRLATAIAAGQPILVDLGDSTFIDGLGARLLADAHRRATEAGLPLCVVLPYAAASPVRRMLLEFAPDLVSYPIVATRSAAATSRAIADYGEVLVLGLERMRELRADLWEAGQRREQLMADRDALIMRQRAALATFRERAELRRLRG